MEGDVLRIQDLAQYHSAKLGHSPRVSRRTQNPAGFYSEDWDELQQEDDEWQVPGKWQRISQFVFHGGCLEIHLDDAGCISRSCTQP